MIFFCWAVSFGICVLLLVFDFVVFLVALLGLALLAIGFFTCVPWLFVLPVALVLRIRPVVFFGFSGFSSPFDIAIVPMIPVAAPVRNGNNRFSDLLLMLWCI